VADVRCAATQERVSEYVKPPVCGDLKEVRASAWETGKRMCPELAFGLVGDTIIECRYLQGRYSSPGSAASNVTQKPMLEIDLSSEGTLRKSMSYMGSARTRQSRRNYLVSVQAHSCQGFVSVNPPTSLPLGAIEGKYSTSSSLVRNEVLKTGTKNRQEAPLLVCETPYDVSVVRKARRALPVIVASVNCLESRITDILGNLLLLPVS
jgi:hypothetical protein